MKIKDMLLSEETLFRNEELFTPDHVPDEFPYRDVQLATLSACVKPALRGSKPLNAFLHGPPATGKTTATKLLFQELRSTSEKVACVHLNAQIYSTPYKIFSEIHKAVFGFTPPETGVPFTRIYDKVFTRLAREKRALIVVLDDVNYLFATGAANGVFYDILRAYEAHPVHTAVWTISTEDENYRLDDRVRSIYQSETVRFAPYTKKEMAAILQARADLGLYPNVIAKPLIARLAAAATDLRHAIELLKRAVLAAEADASRQVAERHVSHAIEQLTKEKPALKPVVLSADEQRVLRIVEKRVALESGALFREACREKDMGYTSFYRIVKSLEAKNKIVVEPVQKAQGKTSTIRIRQ